jgi:thiamine biosynthesis lipoprotein
MTLAVNSLPGYRSSQHQVLAFLCLLIAACSPAPDYQSIAGDTMGTRYHITWLADGDRQSPGEVQPSIDALLEDINDSMSTYRRDSEISRFNALPPGEWVSVSGPFATVFAAAREIASASDGAYDVTVAPLVNAWGFGPQVGAVIPPLDVLEEALGRVGEQAVELDYEQLRMRKQRLLELDFSSIAKGYAVDVVANWLTARGIEHFMVEIGGELRLAGSSPRGTPWRIAVEQPEASRREIATTLELGAGSMATSGDYRNFFEVDGVRYSHAIDARTGWPVRHELVSVTVVHQSAMIADAWATALIVLGREQALRVALDNHLAVYLISRSDAGFIEEKSAAMVPYLQ